MEDDESDAKLNVKSADFNPRLALYSDRVVVPRPDALVLDNVAKFEVLFAESKEKTIPVDELLKMRQPKGKEVQPSTSKEIILQHQFQKNQGTNEGAEKREAETKRTRRPIRNVLTRISSASGPLAFLRDCMEKRIRVKVWTRNASGIRGYCHGFVVAFDKHWNLALCDVTEVWSRRVKRKTISYGQEFDPPRGWKAMGPMVTPPKTVILKTEKGVEKCERHVNQMLMRGEHVAFISVIDAN